MRKPREEKYHYIPVVDGAQIHLIPTKPDEDRCNAPRKINQNAICGIYIKTTVTYEDTLPIAATAVEALNAPRGTYCYVCLGKAITTYEDELL